MAGSIQSVIEENKDFCHELLGFEPDLIIVLNSLMQQLQTQLFQAFHKN